MDILINVVGQQLKTVTNLKSVVSGTQNFVRFQFDLDDDWDGLLVYAQFIQNNALLTPVYLDEKKSCYLPPEVHSGKCQLALYGVGNKTISGSRQAVIGTTNYLVLDVIDNVLRGDPSHEEFTPTQYQQLLQRISNIETMANTNSSRINSLTDSKVNQSDFNTFANNINQSISQEAARAMAKENDLELNKVGFSNLAETNRNLMAEVERATTAETNLNSNKLDKSEFTMFVQDNTPDSGNYGELVDRVEYLENNPASPETIESSVTNWLNQHPEATTTVADGTITEAKLSTSVNESLDKADNSWQKNTSETDTPTEGSWESIYDPDGHGAEGVDPYSYAENQGIDAIARMRGIIADNIDDGNQIFTVTDSDSTDHTYTGVDAALAGVYSLANDYVDGQLANYNSINIVVDPEDWPLATGEPNTFYLIPKGNGKYEKWWYITDENDTPTWDNFGSSSTEVVDELPLTPDEDVDYILEEDGQYYYYKYIDSDWVLISGGGTGSGSESAQIIQRDYAIDYFQHGTPDNEITASATTVGKYYLDLDTMDVYGGNITTDNTDPENPVTVYGWELIETLVAEPSADIAYYCQFGNDSNLIQFRYVDDEFIMVGDVLEKNPVFNALSQAVTTNAANIARNANDITTNAGNLTSLSQTVSTLMDTLNNLDTEGYTYDISLDEAEDSQGNTRYRLTLLETKDNVETPKTYVFLPEGTGGGGGQATTSILRVDKITSSPIIATPSDSIVIEINYSSTSPVDDQGQVEEYDGTYVWKSDGNTILSGNLVQGRNTFDLTEYCFTGTQKLTLTVTDETGNMSVKSWTVQIVNVRIETAFNDRFTQPIGRPVNFTYTPYGAISKTVHFKLDGVELESVSTTASSTLQSYTIPAQSHGSHLLEVWMTATVNNTNIETNHIYKDIIWYDEANNNPVIGCIYRYDYYGQVTARQYDTTAIVYNVFDPSTNYPIVKRYVDNVLISTETMESSNTTWNYKSETVGTHTLRIECRNTSVTIVMNITELGIDVDPITGGLEIDFNPIGITNNSSNRIWHNDNYHMSVSNNFDWANGGYRTDEKGDTYFLIKAGTTASFDYEMFAGNPSNNVSNTGAEMKIVFMTENVQDASAVWFSNVETISTTVDNTTVTTNMGIEMGVHNGWLKTNKASTTDVEIGEGESVESVAATNTYLYMPYSEEDIIEMDINIDMLDTENANAQAFVMSYEDGVPAKAYLYDSSDRFYQYTPQPITIGSNYCDVRIYRLKIYSSSLTTEGIMKNFIADSRDSTTMLDRYDRNSIYYDREHQVYTPYSTQGSLDPERLAPTIPNVKVLMLETDHFTTSKKTFVKSSLRCIHAPGGDLYVGDPYYDNWYFENGYHAGQGTTSDNYGNSGRNVDFLFNCDGTHKPSDKVNAEAGYVSQVTLGYRTENAHTEVCTDWKGDTGKITLTRTSVPNNFFNLKVNYICPYIQ